MMKIYKKIHVLLHLDWKWARTYYTKRLKLYTSYFLSKLVGRKHWDVNVNGVHVKLSFVNYYQHYIAKSLAKDAFESELLRIWEKQSEEKGVVFDLGGYNGIYGIVSAIANPKSIVYIFEPETTNCAQIRQNIMLNEVTNVELIEAVVFNKSGKSHFNIHEGGTGGCINPDSKLEVQCWALDDFCKQHPYPTLIKIDIEGAEYRALLGAQNIISKTKPKMLLEVHQKFLYRYNDSEKDLYSFLEQTGYKKLWLEQNDWTTHYWVY